MQTQFDFGRGHRNDIVCHIARNAATKFETEVLLLYSTLVIVLRVLAGIRLFCSKNRIDSLADIRPVNSSAVSKAVTLSDATPVGQPGARSV